MVYEFFLTLNLPAMKQKNSSIKQKTLAKDHGKDLLDILLVLITLLMVLWYFKI
jgi:hypothetical protein